MSQTTIDDVMRVMLDAFPQAEIGEDHYGQIVIYTNLRELSDGRVIPFEGN